MGVLVSSRLEAASVFFRVHVLPVVNLPTEAIDITPILRLKRIDAKPAMCIAEEEPMPVRHAGHQTRSQPMSRQNKRMARILLQYSQIGQAEPIDIQPDLFVVNLILMERRRQYLHDDALRANAIGEQAFQDHKLNAGPRPVD